MLVEWKRRRNQHRGVGVGHATVVEAERLAHDALRAVGADDPLGTGPLIIGQRDVDAFAVLV